MTRFIHVSGDVNYIDHGGAVLDKEAKMVEIVEGHYWEQEEPIQNFTIYQVALGRFADVSEEWFYDSLKEMAKDSDLEIGEITALFSPESTDEQNAAGWHELGARIGFGELDSYPLTMNRHEVHLRYGEAE